MEPEIEVEVIVLMRLRGNEVTVGPTHGFTKWSGKGKVRSQMIGDMALSAFMQAGGLPLVGT